MPELGGATAYDEQTPAQRAALLERLGAAEGDPRRAILLRGATVVTMDPRIGDLATGDVLVRGEEVEAVAPDLSDAAADGQAIEVGLDGMVLVPGLCDAHRHCWQTQFRRLLCDVDDLDTYVASTHGGIALHYRPEDMYAGTLLGMLGALDSGVTSVLDFSHNSRSAAHSDAVLRAYRDAGIRAVHASAPPNAGEWDGQWPDDVGRLAAGSNGLVSVRMGIDMRPRPTPELVARARELGVAVTIDGAMGPASGAEIQRLADAGALGPDVTLIHCTDFAGAIWERIADSGARVTLAPTSDQQIGIADGLSPIQRALDHGIRPSLSVDVEISLASDLFTQMRTVLMTQRMMAAAERYHDRPAPPMLSTRDVLEFATVRGAQDIGLESVVGTIAPGKASDLVAIQANAVNNMPLNSATGTVVLGTDPRNVAIVLVAGAVRKWDGALVGLDVARARRLVTDSRDRVMADAGFDLDLFAPARGWPGGSHGYADRARGADGPDWGATPQRAAEARGGTHAH